MKRRPTAAAGRSVKLKPAAAPSRRGGVREVSYPDSVPANPDGAKLRAFQLEGDGLRVEVINWGAYVTKICTPDVDGSWGDVVLGFDTPGDVSGYHVPCLYGGRTHWFGSVIGRYAGRIASGRFELNGQTYQLDKNLGGQHHLHGGKGGWDTHTWTVARMGHAQSGPFLELARVSADGEEGYPAELDVRVKYSISEGNSLRIDYSLHNLDEHRSTVVNVTNHSYFNLSGKFDSSIYDHALLLNAETFLAVDDTGIPVSQKSVRHTPFDFTRQQRIGDRIEHSECDQIAFGSGYDHTYVIRKHPSKSMLGQGNSGLTLAACVTEPSSRRKLEVFTTEPGVHFYSGNHVPFTLNATGKHDTPFGFRSGFCLETQHFPDSPNHPEYPTTVLGPNKRYTSCTLYRFSVARADECLPPRHAVHRLSRPDLA